MAVNDYYAMSSVYLLDGEPCANTWYAQQIAGDAGDDDLSTLAQAFENVILTELVKAQSIDVLYDCLTIRRISSPTSPTAVFPLTLAGTHAGASLPANNVAKLRKYSSESQLQHSGRWFFAGVPEAQQKLGRLDQNYLLSWALFIDAARTTFSALGVDYILKHYSKKEGLYLSVDKITVWPVMTKMRPRTPKRCPTW